MSADNYYLIRKHPDGGYAAVMGFMSNDEEPEVRAGHHRAFATISEAHDAAEKEYSEYGVRLHPECESDRCGLCKEAATGLASIDDTRYCHGDDDPSPSCYEVVQWRSSHRRQVTERLAFDGSGMLTTFPDPYRGTRGKR